MGLVCGASANAAARGWVGEWQKGDAASSECSLDFAAQADDRCLSSSQLPQASERFHVDDEGTIAFFKEVEEDGTRWIDP